MLTDGEARAATDALRVQTFRSSWPRHRDARHARIVEALGEYGDIRDYLCAPRSKFGEGRRTICTRHRAVNDAGGDADRVQCTRQVARVIHGDAKRDRAPVACELLNRSRDQCVALLDVDRLGELLFWKIRSTRRDPREVRGGVDPEALQVRQISSLDQIGSVFEYTMRSNTASSPLPSPRAVVAVNPSSVPSHAGSNAPSWRKIRKLSSAAAWWHSS